MSMGNPDLNKGGPRKREIRSERGRMPVRLIIPTPCDGIPCNGRRQTQDQSNQKQRSFKTPLSSH